MASRGAWLTIAAGVAVALVAVTILRSRWANVPGEPQRSPEEQRLIESLDGASLFHSYCASCHGREGKGGGPASSVLLVTVPDLTRIAKRNGGKFPTELVQKIIAGDEAEIPAHGTREMPVWGPIFQQIAWDQDLGRLCIYNLTQYLESLQQK